VLKPEGTLLYGGGPFGEAFADLRDVWNKHVSRDIGARDADEMNTILAAHGWQIPDSEFKQPVIIRRQPDDMLNALKHRGTSQTWRMSDEQIMTAIAEMEAALAENYPEPDKPVDIEAAFHLGIYHRA